MAKEEKGPEKLKFHVFRDERFIDLNLYQFGWERTAPTHSYGPYARNHYLFHYIIEGRGQLMANEQVYTVTPGHGFLVVPGQVTTYRSGCTHGSSSTACGPTKACIWPASAGPSPSTPPATPTPAKWSKRK